MRRRTLRRWRPPGGGLLAPDTVTTEFRTVKQNAVLRRGVKFATMTLSFLGVRLCRNE